MTTETSLLEIKPRTPPPTNGEAADETLYLIGRPTLREFRRYVRRHAVCPDDDDALAGEWQAAQRHIQRLEKDEAGLADNPSLTPITDADRDYKPLLLEFLKDPLVRHNFNIVPTEIALVELDRLVVWQKHIHLTHVRKLQNRLGPEPDEEDVFRFSLPFEHPHPPVKWSRVRHGKYVFMSPSNDLRFLGTMPLKSRHIANYPPPGSLVGVIGIAVGFGSNFMNAFRFGNRILLNNGSHRACALREAGVTHAPCIVQHCASREELEMVAGEEIAADADQFFNAPRPSMLKDYFDPKLRKLFASRRRHRQVTVKFEVEEDSVPAL
jgi:hypothetical protein